MSETTTIAAQPLLWTLVVGLLVLALLVWLHWRRGRATGEVRPAAKTGTSAAEIDRFFKHSGDLLAIVGLDGHFKRLNPAWNAILGHSEQVGLKTPFIDFVHPDDRMLTMEELGRLANGSETVRFENRYLTAAGDWLWISWTATPLPGGDLFYCVARDVTARRQEEQLLRAEIEAAESANRSKSEFVASISYELRSSMNGILGMTRLALETELDDAQREYMELVDRSARSQLDVITNVLEFSDLDAGKLELEPIAFGLRESLTDTLKALAQRAAEKGLELVYEEDEGVPERIVGDPGRLSQILMHLVGTSIRFTQAGEVHVRIEAARLLEQRVTLRFSVRDTGTGIPEEVQANVFGAVVQPDGSPTRRFGGVGLGLAISSQLVELMGGRLAVEDAVDDRSRFSFSVHFELAEAAEAAPGEEQAVSASGLAGSSVLIVANNEALRTILAEYAARWQMESVVVVGGLAALDTCEVAHSEGRSFDLVLSDLHLNDIDGIELCKRLAAGPHYGVTKVILVTPFTRSDDPHRVRSLRLAGILTKPIMPHELRAAFLGALGEPLGPAAGSASDVLGKRRSGGRILLAEDDIIDRTLAIALLEKQGHEVAVAKDGRAAIHQLERRDFDVVLMDVQMPELDGLEATRLIREGEAGTLRHVPIIAMTAHALRGDRERCLEAGMDDYVSKPIDPEELEHKIRRFLDEQIDFDPVRAMELTGGNTGVFRDVAMMFLDSAAGRLDGIKRAVADSDSDALENGAHSLKGVAASLALHRVRKVSASLEQAGAAGIWDGTSQMVAELELHLDAGFAALRAEVSTIDAQAHQ